MLIGITEICIRCTSYSKISVRSAIANRYADFTSAQQFNTIFVSNSKFRGFFGGQKRGGQGRGGGQKPGRRVRGVHHREVYLLIFYTIKNFNKKNSKVC